MMKKWTNYVIIVLQKKIKMNKRSKQTDKQDQITERKARAFQPKRGKNPPFLELGFYDLYSI